MDPTSPIPDPFARAAPPRLRPHLALDDARFRLNHPAGEIPDDWRAALEALLGWLGIAAEILEASHPGRGGPSLFAPWLGWSPAAFQHGGLAHLPQAQFAASYLIDHPRSAVLGLGGLDLMLLSPHPAQCIADAQGAVPIPGAGVLAAMIRAARAQGRERLAIIVTARQRCAVAARVRGGGKGQTGAGLTGGGGGGLDILTLEEALPILTGPRPAWDAVIAMPEQRSTVFTLLAQVSGICRAWPMVWFTQEGVPALVTSEAPGEGLSRLPLDASALIHTLALTLHAAGAERHAARLHEGWARLRDRGVTPSAPGEGSAPYTCNVADSAFVAMLCRGEAVSKRPQQPWRALPNDKSTIAGSQTALLRVIPAQPNVVSG